MTKVRHTHRLPPMSDRKRIERVLGECLATLDDPATPERLRLAMSDAVFPGGSRLRPRLCLAVAEACDVEQPRVADAAATAVELLHCASLVHDDLPCFDDAPLRRGRPSVHAAYGEEMAVLAGDGLIVMAFEVLARRACEAPQLGRLVACMADAAGAARGLVSGQAWESEPSVGLRRYHRAKTASLFGAAARAGALAAGADPEPWAAFGLRLGEAYQVFDDLRDTGDACELMDKPMGQDQALGRPNAALALGPERALERLQGLLTGARQILPECPRPRVIEQWIASFSARLLPALGAIEAKPTTANGEFRLAAGLRAGG